MAFRMYRLYDQAADLEEEDDEMYYGSEDIEGTDEDKCIWPEWPDFDPEFP